MFQQRAICSRTRSSSLAVNWLPSGACGCDDGGAAAATCWRCGFASGCGIGAVFVRFFSNESKAAVSVLASGFWSVGVVCGALVLASAFFGSGLGGGGGGACASTGLGGGGGGGVLSGCCWAFSAAAGSPRAARRGSAAAVPVSGSARAPGRR